MVTMDADTECSDMKQQQTAVRASVVPLQKLPCNHSPVSFHHLTMVLPSLTSRWAGWRSQQKKPAHGETLNETHNFVGKADGYHSLTSPITECT